MNAPLRLMKLFVGLIWGSGFLVTFFTYMEAHTVILNAPKTCQLSSCNKLVGFSVVFLFLFDLCLSVNRIMEWPQSCHYNQISSRWFPEFFIELNWIKPKCNLDEVTFVESLTSFYSNFIIILSEYDQCKIEIKFE